MNLRFAAVAGFVLLSASSGAAIAADTYLAPGGYPQPNCVKPQQPSKPASFGSDAEVGFWNMQVMRYQSERSIYVQCIKDYIAVAEADMKRVNDAASRAVEEANKP